ncbi:hypothetical protein LZ198_18885 [Myxococcus sp. K15C18031901]|uniref:proton-conducting transporter transmembrane domain-containing protein n=1 Tax=Myxococcus dinghuensis TaxID=2906761 RepID=UPI0020A7EE70|nr:proton-conducting transporter membrane subunit [Myxococcus dinghuensis]MCP3100942.1 hypothetical protein [Myxococcus dinghuensis]
MTPTTLLVPLLLVLPIVGAVSLVGTRTPARALRVATVAASLTLVVALALSWPPTGRARPDDPDALLCPLVSLLTLATLVAGPRQLLDRGMLMALLLTEGAALGVFRARGTLPLLGCLVALPMPLAGLLAQRERSAPGPREARVFHLYMLVGTLPLLAVLGLDLPDGAPGAAYVVHTPRPTMALGLGALAALAVGVRLAVVPFHSWLPCVVTRLPLGVGLVVTHLVVGLFLLERLTPCLGAPALALLGTLGVATALHGAVAAWAQTDLRRMLGFLLSSHSGLVLAGAVLGGAEAWPGARLHAVAMGLSFTGLGLLVQSLERRTGTADTTRLGGLHAPGGRMSVLFLLLALGALGVPGTWGFTSEDLLLRAAVGVHPALALALLLALALGAVTLLRAWQRAFLGPPSPRPFTDLLPRERWTAVALVLALLAGGRGLGESVFPPSMAPSIVFQRAHREAKAIRNRREHHVPVEAAQRPGGPVRGDDAGPERLQFESTQREGGRILVGASPPRPDE